MIQIKVLQVYVVVCVILGVKSTPIHSRPEYTEKFCIGNDEITSVYNIALSFGYQVTISKPLAAATEITVKLDSEGNIRFGSPEIFRTYNARFTSEIDPITNIFSFVLLDDVNDFVFSIKGKTFPYQPPYILSLKINGVENCKNPDLTYFHRMGSITGRAQFWDAAPNKFCGRRKLSAASTQLIVSGSEGLAGDWPWHAAIYKSEKGILQYICGGTLISKFLVLTAAHCATIRGVAINPEMLGVSLGKHKVFGSEITSQDREVYEVIVHEGFHSKTTNNDIALLKLSSEAVFNNYVQPACLWLDEIYDQLPSYQVVGTIVGWGIDQLEKLSKNLHTASMPIASDVTCMRYEPVYYTNMLNGKTFCAGHSNGTSACNGDSGGGFFVFVKDSIRSNPFELFRDLPGAWYVRGIVSNTLARQDSYVCDPNAYTVFTDVAKYRDWVLNYMTTYKFVLITY